MAYTAKQRKEAVEMLRDADLATQLHNERTIVPAEGRLDQVVRLAETMRELVCSEFRASVRNGDTNRLAHLGELARDVASARQRALNIKCDDTEVPF